MTKSKRGITEAAAESLEKKRALEEGGREKKVTQFRFVPEKRRRTKGSIT